MLRAKSFLINRQRALIQRFGLREPALGSVQLAQIVQTRGYKGMLRAERFFIDRQCALIERFSGCVLSLGIARLGQIA